MKLLGPVCGVMEQLAKMVNQICIAGVSSGVNQICIAQGL